MTTLTIAFLSFTQLTLSVYALAIICRGRHIWFAEKTNNRLALILYVIMPVLMGISLKQQMTVVNNSGLAFYIFCASGAVLPVITWSICTLAGALQGWLTRVSIFFEVELSSFNAENDTKKLGDFHNKPADGGDDLLK